MESHIGGMFGPRATGVVEFLHPLAQVILTRGISLCTSLTELIAATSRAICGVSRFPDLQSSCQWWFNSRNTGRLFLTLCNPRGQKAIFTPTTSTQPASPLCLCSAILDRSSRACSAVVIWPSSTKLLRACRNSSSFPSGILKKKYVSLFLGRPGLEGGSS